MTRSLFRQQAIEAKANTLIGKSSLAGPPGFKIVVFVALLAAVALLCIVVFGAYTKKDTVPGYVTTTEANVRVFPMAAGVILESFVSEGDEVMRGQALARISISTSTDVSRSVQSAISDSMKQEASSLRRQISRTSEIAVNRNKALRRHVEDILFQIGVIKEQQASALERLQLAERNHIRILDLRENGLISEAEVDDSRSEILDVKLDLNGLDRELGMQRNSLDQRQLEIEQSPAVDANNLAELEAKLGQVEQRIANVEGQDALIIVAPVDGRVSELGRRVGQLMTTDTPLVSLLPLQTSYYAELYVPTRSIGFVREGSEVQIRYDAYPYQKYGVFAGVVTRIATTPVRPREADAPIELREPSYLLTVSLDDQKILADGELQPLHAGMTLQADIVRETRRIIQWMFDPIASAVRRTQ